MIIGFLIAGTIMFSGTVADTSTLSAMSKTLLESCFNISKIIFFN